MKADVAANSGCKLDSERVWSSNTCAGGILSMAGSSDGLSTVPEKCSDKTAALKVRCCADQPTTSGVTPSFVVEPKTCSELGWKVAGASPFVCANSEFVGKTCGTSATFQVAQAACLGRGARLCSSEELSNDDAKGSGCKLDDKMVWSSTSCTGGHLVQMGSFQAGMQPQCMPSGTAGVRCCADEPKGVSTGQQTCEALGWTVSAVVNQVGVCAESKIRGQCGSALSASNARLLCAGVGARVCSQAQLESDAAKGSGCKLDDVRVWTSTQCAGGFITRSGSAGTADAQCSDATSAFPVRCCAFSSIVAPGGRAGVSATPGVRG